MSNFNCEICGCPILEGDDGNYITGCKHYPLEKIRDRKLEQLIEEEYFKKEKKDE